jgi:hypothetical protein
MESEKQFSPSPLWGGLGWGLRRIDLLSDIKKKYYRPSDPHPNPPHKGDGTCSISLLRTFK